MNDMDKFSHFLVWILFSLAHSICYSMEELPSAIEFNLSALHEISKASADHLWALSLLYDNRYGPQEIADPKIRQILRNLNFTNSVKCLQLRPNCEEKYKNYECHAEIKSELEEYFKNTPKKYVESETKFSRNTEQFLVSFGLGIYEHKFFVKPEVIDQLKKNPKRMIEFDLGILHIKSKKSHDHLQALSLIYNNLHNVQEIADPKIRQILQYLDFTNKIKCMKLGLNCEEKYKNYECHADIKSELEEYFKNATKEYVESETKFSRNTEQFLVSFGLGIYEYKFFLKQEVIDQLDEYLGRKIKIGRTIGELD
jgi:hypothetical protein